MRFRPLSIDYRNQAITRILTERELQGVPLVRVHRLPQERKRQPSSNPETKHTKPPTQCKKPKQEETRNPNNDPANTNATHDNNVKTTCDDNGGHPTAPAMNDLLPPSLPPPAKAVTGQRNVLPSKLSSNSNCVTIDETHDVILLLTNEPWQEGLRSHVVCRSYAGPCEEKSHKEEATTTTAESTSISNAPTATNESASSISTKDSLEATSHGTARPSCASRQDCRTKASGPREPDERHNTSMTINHQHQNPYVHASDEIEHNRQITSRKNNEPVLQEIIEVPNNDRALSQNIPLASRAPSVESKARSTSETFPASHSNSDITRDSNAPTTTFPGNKSNLSRFFNTPGTTPPVSLLSSNRSQPFQNPQNNGDPTSSLLLLAQVAADDSPKHKAAKELERLRNAGCHPPKPPPTSHNCLADLSSGYAKDIDLTQDNLIDLTTVDPLEVDQKARSNVTPTTHSKSRGISRFQDRPKSLTPPSNPKSIAMDTNTALQSPPLPSQDVVSLLTKENSDHLEQNSSLNHNTNNVDSDQNARERLMEHHPPPTDNNSSGGIERFQKRQRDEPDQVKTQDDDPATKPPRVSFSEQEINKRAMTSPGENKQDRKQRKKEEKKARKREKKEKKRQERAESQEKQGREDQDRKKTPQYYQTNQIDDQLLRTRKSLTQKPDTNLRGLVVSKLSGQGRMPREKLDRAGSGTENTRQPKAVPQSKKPQVASKRETTNSSRTDDFQGHPSLGAHAPLRPLQSSNSLVEAGRTKSSAKAPRENSHSGAVREKVDARGNGPRVLQQKRAQASSTSDAAPAWLPVAKKAKPTETAQSRTVAGPLAIPATTNRTQCHPIPSRGGRNEWYYSQQSVGEATVEQVVKNPNPIENNANRDPFSHNYNPDVEFYSRPTRQSPTIVLCAEAFLEDWGPVVGALATGRWSNRQQGNLMLEDDEQTQEDLKIVSRDTPLVDQCMIDIELPGRRALQCIKLSNLVSEEDAKECVLNLASLSATLRYRTIFVFLVHDIKVSSPIAKRIFQLQSLMLAPQNQNCTHLCLKAVTEEGLAGSIAEVVIGLVRESDQDDILIETLQDEQVAERAKFLLALLPTLSVFGALEILRMVEDGARERSSQTSFGLLFSDARMRQQITFAAEANDNIHSLAMMQLQACLSAPLSS